MQAAGEELVIAIRKVNRGDSYLSPLIARDTVTFLLNGKQTFQRHITQRQSEILHLLAGGMSMKQVADHIDVKPGTVAFHKYKMMETLNIKTSAELIGYALKRQMLSREVTLCLPDAGIPSADRNHDNQGSLLA
jgi:DNA-binding NarL/FixJ family response regulator